MLILGLKKGLTNFPFIFGCVTIIIVALERKGKVYRHQHEHVVAFQLCTTLQFYHQNYQVSMRSSQAAISYLLLTQDRTTTLYDVVIV